MREWAAGADNYSVATGEQMGVEMGQGSTEASGRQVENGKKVEKKSVELRTETERARETNKNHDTF